MTFLLSINWISLLALVVVLLLFVLIRYLEDKINWTLLILLSLVIGAIVGVIFSSEGNAYLVWVKLLGNIYVNVITALVVPVILVSIISSFISLKNKSAVKTIGIRSVVWLLVSAAAAIVLSLLAGLLFKLWDASSVFENIARVSDSTVSAYEGLKKSFDDILLGFFPSNIAGDVAANNIVALIITAVAIALAYISIANKEGEEKVISFRKLVEAVKEIIFKILNFVIDLTPYAVLCLIASSAGAIFSNGETLVQLLLLVVIIYAVSFFHAYVFNGVIVRFVAKLNPFKFFKKIFQAQATAFTTQSSVGTLPVTIDSLKRKVGVSDEVANFTAPLGTTIGMPGCTCIWPVLLVMFFVNASGMNWGVGDYILLAVVTFIMSIGSAGVPGIALVSSIAVFGTLGLPVAAVVLLVPINTVSDMARTLDNVTSAAVATAIVARKENQLDDALFDSDEKPISDKVKEGQ